MDLTGKKDSENQRETLNCLTAANEISELREKACSVQILFFPLIPADTALKYLQMPLQAQQMLPQHLCYSLHNVYHDEYHLGNTGTSMPITVSPRRLTNVSVATLLFPALWRLHINLHKPTTTVKQL